MIRDGVTKTGSEIGSFLLIGQSNMAGRGEFSDVSPIINRDCFMLRMGRWQKMSEPINPDRAVVGTPFHSGTCLATSFADEVSRRFSQKVGLIPCADGGTRITQWMPGEVLYDHAVMMTRLAMRSSRLRGILWHQGESDCHTEEEFLRHKQLFFDMITSLRRDLGAEDLPLLVGELSEHIDESYGLGDRPSRMNLQYRELADELPHCRIVSAEGLSLKPDGLHFNAVSLRTFGVRYFEEYCKAVEEI